MWGNELRTHWAGEISGKSKWRLPSHLIHPQYSRLPFRLKWSGFLPRSSQLGSAPHWYAQAYLTWGSKYLRGSSDPLGIYIGASILIGQPRADHENFAAHLQPMCSASQDQFLFVFFSNSCPLSYVLTHVGPPGTETPAPRLLPEFWYPGTEPRDRKLVFKGNFLNFDHF